MIVEKFLASSCKLSQNISKEQVGDLGARPAYANWAPLLILDILINWPGESLSGDFDCLLAPFNFCFSFKVLNGVSKTDKIR